MFKNIIPNFALLAVCLTATAGLSPVWKQFKQEKETGKLPTVIPDFSYAGYHYGTKAIAPKGKIFNVTNFGATPNDHTDDTLAVMKTVEAAKKAGGGIVYFPAGRFIFNTDMAKRRTIKIDASNIIIRGAGSQAGGTILHLIHPFGGGKPHDFHRLHLGRNLFLVHSPAEETRLANRKAITKITSHALQGSFTFEVADASSLKEGQFVISYAKNKGLFLDLIKPYQPEKRWTNLTNNKSYACEIMQIKAIKGNKITVYAPLNFEIKPEYDWILKKYQPIEEVGFEDLTFMGNWHQGYIHHRSGIDDSGWAMIKFKGVHNGFIRRCNFINVNQVAAITLSSHVSVLNINVAGNEGHHTPRVIFYSNGVFGGYVNDMANFSHGPSLNYGTSSTVFYRCRSMGGIDSHGGKPLNSLFDNIATGQIRSSGGVRDYPQHLRGLVLWNCENICDKLITYDFWKKHAQNAFVKPIIVGFHGKRAIFDSSKLEILESKGKAVEPESLFEAQTQLRMGHIPAWLEQAAKDDVVMRTQKLPAYYHRNDPASVPFFQIETFKVDDLLKFVTSISMQMWNTKLYTYKLKNKELTMTTDQTFVRDALYSAMYSIYLRHKDNNTITVEEHTFKGKTFIKFILKSGELKSAPRPLPNCKYYKDAVKFVKILDGKIEFIENSNHYEIHLTFKQSSASNNSITNNTKCPQCKNTAGKNIR